MVVWRGMPPYRCLHVVIVNAKYTISLPEGLNLTELINRLKITLEKKIKNRFCKLLNTLLHIPPLSECICPFIQLVSDVCAQSSVDFVDGSTRCLLCQNVIHSKFGRQTIFRETKGR